MNDKVTEIWKNFHSHLYAFILKKVNDKEFAEDILMDVFIKIQTKLSDLKDIDKLQSWIFQITRNAINDHYRSKRFNYEFAENQEILEEEEDNQLMNNTEHWLKNYINVLPDKYREAILSTDINGIPIKELADNQGITYVNAKARVQRGRKMLKQNLDECCTFYVDKYGKVLDVKNKDSSCSDCQN
jgi:RNA polymerase sigma-70 factor (ECF subfamily)